MTDEFKAYAQKGQVLDEAYRRLVMLQEKSTDDSKRRAARIYLQNHGAVPLLKKDDIISIASPPDMTRALEFFLIPDISSAAVFNYWTMDPDSKKVDVWVEFVGPNKQTIDSFVDNMVSEINKKRHPLAYRGFVPGQ